MTHETEKLPPLLGLPTCSKNHLYLLFPSNGPFAPRVPTKRKNPRFGACLTQKNNHLTTISLRCLISRPAAEKLFFKKIPLILMGLGRGGATPATPNVFGNCFLLHPVNNPVRLPSNKMNIQHSCSVQNRPSMPRFVSSRNGMTPPARKFHVFTKRKNYIHLPCLKPS